MYTPRDWELLLPYIVSRDQVFLTAAATGCGRQSQSVAVASVFTPSDLSHLDSTDSEMFRITKTDEKLTGSVDSQRKSVHIQFYGVTCG
jgi:hypothetical protein